MEISKNLLPVTTGKDKVKKSGINVVEYVKKEMSTFFQKPFNSIDSLVLSQLSYINVGGIVNGISEQKDWTPIYSFYKAEYFYQMYGTIWSPEDNAKFIAAVCASPRYRNILANYYVNMIDLENEVQFSAITFLLPTGMSYVAFRGTDASIIGWKEDFNMTFMCPVPSQVSASEYLKVVSGYIENDIYIGGHSKGGNLAAYSAATAPLEVQERIVTIYNHDGPGFTNEVLDTQGYINISNKIDNVIPKDSLIGLLLENSGNYRIVESKRTGAMQHDPFSWLIHGDDFIYTDKVGNSAQRVNEIIKQWFEKVAPEERQIFVDTLFKIIQTTGANRIADLQKNTIKDADIIRKAAKDIDPETVQCIKAVILELARVSFQNVMRSKRKIERAQEKTRQEILEKR